MWVNFDKSVYDFFKLYALSQVCEGLLNKFIRRFL